jgi:TolA-binding protein
MKKILLFILLFMGLTVHVHAEVAELKKQNNYVFDEEQGYAIPSDSYCRKYVDIIKEKEKQIKALKQELASLQGGEQQDLQKQLKTKYDKEMKEIDEKRSKRVKKDTTSSIIISDKPVP